MSEFTTILPKDLYKASQVRELDRIAIKEMGISSFDLMKTAGAAVFKVIKKAWPESKRILVLTGSGNNGGDGYIVAAMAKESGMSVEVIQLCAGSNLKGDAKLACEHAESCDVIMQGFTDTTLINNDFPNTIIVDALIGTGIQRKVAGAYKRAIQGINSISCPVVAVDIPSGLNSDTGKPMDEAVEANITVTFIGVKQGLLTCNGRDYSGDILFENLDLPDSVFESDASPSSSVRRIDINHATRHLPPRKRSSHKKSHGHVVIVGGDLGFGGAGILAAEAAYRSGSGLVSLITRTEHRAAALARRPEMMVIGTEDSNIDLESILTGASAIAIGPGLGTSEWGRQLLQLVLRSQRDTSIPLVVDADALNLLSEKTDVSVKVRPRNWVFTPHPGEAAKLLGCTTIDIQNDRFTAIKTLVENWSGTFLLKGSGSLTCSSTESSMVYLCTEGNAGMASGGMGDVLSGIVVSLIGQGLSLVDALNCAICVHGEAGDLAKESGGERGLLGADLFPYLRQLVNPPIR